MCPKRETAWTQCTHFCRLTRPIVTANAKFLSYKIIALFIDSGCSGGFPNSLPQSLVADFAAPRNNTAMMS
jgi:hypothetical protein